MRTIVAIFFSIVVVLLSLLLPHYGIVDWMHMLEVLGAIVFVLAIGFLVTFSIPQEQTIRIVYEEKEREENKIF